MVMVVGMKGEAEERMVAVMREEGIQGSAFCPLCSLCVYTFPVLFSTIVDVDVMQLAFQYHCSSLQVTDNLSVASCCLCLSCCSCPVSCCFSHLNTDNLDSFLGNIIFSILLKKSKCYLFFLISVTNIL